MKDAQTISVDDAIASLDRFDLILDARSPAEHAEDRLPGAIGAAVLDDAQRAHVGTLYKQAGAFEAKRVGAALVSRNIAGIIETTLATAARDAKLLVYCWRGGNRSGALATVLARIGWRTCQLDGGYKAFRKRVLADLEVLPERLRLVVVTGRTGSGKSMILERLAARGAQVLDLEAIARHRGSVLGHFPDRPQPTQKHFETSVWTRLREFDPQRPVFVESESRKIGQCQVPAALILAMRASSCVRIDADDDLRCRLLLAEYTHFVDDPAWLAARLAALVDLHGRARIDGWMQAAHAGDWMGFVRSLLNEHYDPAYDRSMRRNFGQLDQAPVVSLESDSAAAFDAAAARIGALFDSR